MTDTDLRCAVQTRGLGELPAGSATAADHFLLVELPLPWPAKIEDHPMVASLPSPPEGSGTLRILGIRGDDSGTSESGTTDSDSPEAASADSCTVISYRRTPQTPFNGFERAEARVAADQLGEVLAGIVNGDRSHLVRADAGDTTVDVLICTHGSRDRCCGQMGSLLFIEMADTTADHVRMWRTSHTGGHRFAPTGITFPDGMTWSFLDAHILSGILQRSIGPIDLKAHFRGCAGLENRPAQIADAVAFERVGWDWLSGPRAAVVHEREQTAPGREFEVYIAGSGQQFTVSLVEEAAVPVPVCGADLDQSMKATPSFVVTDIALG